MSWVDRVFYEQDGWVNQRTGRGQMRVVWVLLFGAMALVAVCVGVSLGVAKPIMEAGCNQQAQQLGVVDGDYRLLSDECYLTLDSGEVIPAKRYRVTEATER